MGCFAEKTFTLAKMRKYLPQKAVDGIENLRFGKRPNKALAEVIAKGVLKWATEQGATKFVHWFTPLDGRFAGKCQSTDDFSRELFVGETDASSFPTGSLRSADLARGLTVWDGSPPFVLENCLFVPCVFRGSDGSAPDNKIALLRSSAALEKQSKRLLALCGMPAKKVTPVVGAEQEYFLVDREKFLQRQDLVRCGKTLFGTPKSLPNNYFCPPSERVAAFWKEVDQTLASIGIAVKSLHSEVSPCQFEIVPEFAPAPLACDGNGILTFVLQRVARRHNLACLLHEKPFCGINGSGKHNNFSLLADGENLFDCGCDVKKQGRFLLFLSCFIRAVDRHSDLLEFSAASCGNDCRLGGFEAPPRIISVHLGRVEGVVSSFLSDTGKQAGRDKLPGLPQDFDRNRTSTVAFVGNKFELRLVGSAQQLYDVNTALNVAFASSIKAACDRLEKSADFWRDAHDLIAEIWKNHGKIVFSGNNYSQDWKLLSAARGLVPTPQTPFAADCLLRQKTVDTFAEQGVLSKKELAARWEISLETYRKTVVLQCDVLAEICKKQVSAFLADYGKDLAERTLLFRSLGQKNKQTLCNKVNKLSRSVLWWARRLENSAKTAAEMPLEEGAKFACTTLQPMLEKVRKVVETAENICPQKYWKIPTVAQILT